MALMVHHTAGAATSSTRASHPGNQKGANKGVINYVQVSSACPRLTSRWIGMDRCTCTVHIRFITRAADRSRVLIGLLD